MSGNGNGLGVGQAGVQVVPQHLGPGGGSKSRSDLPQALIHAKGICEGGGTRGVKHAHTGIINNKADDSFPPGGRGAK